MDESLLADNVDLRRALDTLPGLIFIVDHDVRIMYLNTAARDILGLELARIYRVRAGMALDCVNDCRTTQGCGRSAACEDCVIRAAVGDAIQGFRSDHTSAQLKRMQGGVEKTLNLQVTAFPLRYGGKPYVLLILEPSTDLIHS